MRLFVYVLEATGLPCPSEAYVKLKVGERKSRTRTVRGGADPVWNEEFVFRMEDEWEEESGDEEEEQVFSVRVFHKDDAGGGFFGGGHGKLLGQVDVSLWAVFGDGRQTLPPTWFPLRRRRGHNSKGLDCGKNLLTVSMYGRRNDEFAVCPSVHPSYIKNASPKESLIHNYTPQANSSAHAYMKPNMDDSVPDEKRSMQTLAGQFVQRLLHGNKESGTSVSRSANSLELAHAHTDAEIESNDNVTRSTINFEEAIE